MRRGVKKAHLNNVRRYSLVHLAFKIRTVRNDPREISWVPILYCRVFALVEENTYREIET